MGLSCCGFKTGPVFGYLKAHVWGVHPILEPLGKNFSGVCGFAARMVLLEFLEMWCKLPGWRFPIGVIEMRPLFKKNKQEIKSYFLETSRFVGRLWARFFGF